MPRPKLLRDAKINPNSPLHKRQIKYLKAAGFHKLAREMTNAKTLGEVLAIENRVIAKIML